MIGSPQVDARARALRARMTQQCQLVKLGPSYYDENLHKSVQSEIVLWAGPCLVRPANTSSRQVENAGQTMQLKTYTGWLPMTAALAGAEFLVIDGWPRLTILDAPFDSWPISRRVILQQAS